MGEVIEVNFGKQVEESSQESAHVPERNGVVQRLVKMGRRFLAGPSEPIDPSKQIPRKPF